MTEIDLTGLIVRTTHATSIDDLSAETLGTVKLSILDSLACSVAGSREDGPMAVAGWAHDSGGDGKSTIIGTPLRTSPAFAALANGTAGHALDYDDVSMRMIHPSVNLVPALFGVGEPGHVSGRALLDAYVAGFEVQVRLCRELNPEHYDRGWHSTGTVGSLGSAMGVARLLGLDEDRSRWALGIAGSSSSAIRKNFGSMVKALHAGQAAFHGLQAAELASRGFTGDRSILEGRNGFLQMFSTEDVGARLYDTFASVSPYEVAESGIAIKRFACCGAIHTAQDAILELMENDPFEPEDVVRIECRVNRLIPNILVHHVTQDGLEGKFSMEYSVAVCLIDRMAGLAQYRPERAADPRLVPIMERTEVTVDESIPVNLAFFPSVVTVELADRRVLRTRVDVPKGYPAHPLSVDEVIAKARDCCESVLRAEQFEALVDTVLELEVCPDIALLAPSISSTA